MSEPEIILVSRGMREHPASSFLRQDLSLASLAEAADVLVACGWRNHATRWVDELLPEMDDRRALLLLARLHMEGGRQRDIEAALVPLAFWRMLDPWDMEAVALYRFALVALGRTAEIVELDTELTWGLRISPSE